ncbi:hypothetical protein I8752_10935 [Nostocaceae cyanobacterium CENA369]|uniref:Uncharacterized protein n=1 Tax=Dendronalium phyllosphericum CENA369 TaxID=1725256 RepID=A0A8J7I6Z0_9NOST|nr:hypothetical protein [Dendronalium phyllosphericum]MBH8573522.1 hypothetical protein [Dendronalium phyllosphericum CENA369]
MRLQFDDKINRLPKTSRRTFTGDASSVLSSEDRQLFYAAKPVTTLAHRTGKFES